MGDLRGSRRHWETRGLLGGDLASITPELVLIIVYRIAKNLDDFTRERWRTKIIKERVEILKKISDANITKEAAQVLESLSQQVVDDRMLDRLLRMIKNKKDGGDD